VFTRDDLIDLIVSRLKAEIQAAPKADSSAISAPQGKSYPYTMLPKGRIFLSEYEIKKRLTVSGEHLTIPREAIISPLAVDWLVLKGIKIVREQ
jgi:hypothetical protein